MLLGHGVDIDATVLVESFLDYMSDVDRSVLNTAIEFSKHTSSKKYPPDLQEKILTTHRVFGCRQVPSPGTLSLILTGIAKYVFLTNPMSAICAIHQGIPSNHKPFWSSTSPPDLHMIYQALTGAPSKVLSLLEEPVFINAAQKAVFGYLHQYIRNMTLDQVRLF